MTQQLSGRALSFLGLCIFFGLSTLVGTLGCSTPTPSQIAEVSPCINKLDDLPKDWQPSPKVRPSLNDAPWTRAEQELADQSVMHGLDEMVDYQSSKPETVTSLWDNSVEAYIDTAYSADNMPALRDKALGVAQRHLTVISAPSMKTNAAKCHDVSTFLTLVIYAHTLSKRMADDEALTTLRSGLIAKTNASIADCGSLKAVLGYEYTTFLASTKTANGDVYDMVMWSILFIDALTIPELNMPTGTDTFVSALWRYLATYPTPDAVTFEGGANHATFYDLAYLMTHVGYVPTGYGRHALSVRTAPWLYRFLRANFYAVMEMGELDLTAEFVDLFRQYGCDETNDRQLRDGSRHLLTLYRSAGLSWINYRESYETPECNPYDLMHKPWTAIAGLRQRQFEPASGGTYGEIAKRLLNAQ